MAITSREPNPDQARVISTSKRIELSYRLVDDDGNALGPPPGVVGMFKGVYPTPHAVELSAPFVIYSVGGIIPNTMAFHNRRPSFTLHGILTMADI